MTNQDLGQGPKPPVVERRIAVHGWTVVHTTGSAADFHHSPPPETPGHQVWIHRIPRPALVLGSTQPQELVNATRAEHDGIEICRRRSGGGLVFIDPRTDCWIDVIVPRDSPRWLDDVAKAFHWVGHLWASVLTDGGSIGNQAASVSLVTHRTEAGRVWCFADLGHGEVSVGGSKVVGLSQRRTRTWARIQCLALGSWPGRLLLPYVNLEAAADAPEQTAHLDPGLVIAGPPANTSLSPPTRLAERFVASLPRLAMGQTADGDR